MSAHAVIDSLAFSRLGREVSGTRPVERFERLHDALHDQAGELQYSVRGGTDNRGRPALRVEVNGTLNLRCLRCLEALTHPVAIDTWIRLVGSEAELTAAEDADEEAILADPKLRVLDLVEDEVLLGLPMVPRHEEECGVPLGVPNTGRQGQGA